MHEIKVVAVRFAKLQGVVTDDDRTLAQMWRNQGQRRASHGSPDVDEHEVDRPFHIHKGLSQVSLTEVDQVGQAGNRICFIGAGYGSLYDYCYSYLSGVCVEDWSRHMKSLWAGSSTGFTYNHDICRSSFSAWERHDQIGCQIDNYGVELDSN